MDCFWLQVFAHHQLINSSYSAILASFFRTVRPDLVVGAVASSAPVQFEYNCTQFYDQAALSLNNSLYGGSPDCYNAVLNTFTEIDEIISNGDTSKLGELFNICPYQINSNNNFVLASTFNLILGGLVQYSRFLSFVSMVTQ